MHKHLNVFAWWRIGKDTTQDRVWRKHGIIIPHSYIYSSIWASGCGPNSRTKRWQLLAFQKMLHRERRARCQSSGHNTSSCAPALEVTRSQPQRFLIGRRGSNFGSLPRRVGVSGRRPCPYVFACLAALLKDIQLFFQRCSRNCYARWSDRDRQKMGGA